MVASGKSAYQCEITAIARHGYVADVGGCQESGSGFFDHAIYWLGPEIDYIEPVMYPRAFTRADVSLSCQCKGKFGEPPSDHVFAKESCQCQTVATDPNRGRI